MSQDPSRPDSDTRAGEVDTRSATHEGQFDPLELAFDQHERYRLVADLCREIADDGAITVLDVGGRTGILRRMLPGVRVELVDLEAADEDGLVLGSGSRLPFQDDSVDVVTANDTLEHVPTDQREVFITECCRVARKAVVIAGPYQHPDVDEAERIVQGFLKEKLDLVHRYLDEHRTLGLPDLEATEAACMSSGAREVVAIGKGNLDRWLGLVSLALYLDDEPRMRDVARKLYRLVNEDLVVREPLGLVYRHAVVALFGDTTLPDGGRGRPLDLDPERTKAIAHMGREILAFDQHRDLVVEERNHLSEVIDRAGVDLDLHKAENEELRTDLDGHRDSLTEARGELSQAYEVLDEIKERLQEHKEVLRDERAAREAEKADLEDIAEKLRGEIAALTEHRDALVGEVALVRGEAHAIQAELLHKTRYRRKVKGWIAKLRGKA